MRSLSRLFGAVAAVAAAVTITAATAPAARFHTKLVKSTPAAHDTLATAPKTIQLWFSEKVELAVTTVTLATSTGTDVALAAPTRDDKTENAPIVLAISKPLTAGAYIVSYTVAAKDGHPTKGTIDFVVKGH